MDAPRVTRTKTLRRIALLLAIGGLVAGFAQRVGRGDAAAHRCQAEQRDGRHQDDAHRYRLPREEALHDRGVLRLGVGRHREPVQGGHQGLGGYRRARSVLAEVSRRAVRRSAWSGPTSQICYIGNPHAQGVDTIALRGAAKVTVTYP